MNLELKEKLVLVAIGEAEIAVKKGNSPFGAVLSDSKGNIIARSYNTSTSDINPTAHAEINLIKKVCKKFNTKNLSEYYLISNAESCPMCMSAAIKAGIKNFIFGAPTESDSNPYITVFDISKFSKYPLNIETGILKEKCIEQIINARKLQVE